jgi:5S rRNA maturation endonuclease (ribonuclease M5)
MALQLQKMKTKKYHSYSQHQLKKLCDIVCDNLESILGHFDIDYRNTGKMLSMSCPIHGGDNPTAVNIYPNGDNYRGNWKCRTHGCEKVFQGSVLGFLRGILSKSKLNWTKSGDSMYSFNATIEYIKNLIDIDLNQINESTVNIDKTMFMNTVRYVSGPKVSIDDQPVVSRQSVIKSLSIPSEYYINRGFSTEILSKYDVGECTNPKKPMYQRVVVPIYDINHKTMIGCTGRSIHNKCIKCKAYHDPAKDCIEENDLYKFPKWKHSTGFKSQENLYNLWFAKTHIQQTKSVIIVESPGNVWRLEESGIHNSVAIFGSSMSDIQKMLIDTSGAMSIFILTDRDEAGEKAAEQIINRCKNTYRTFRLLPEANDVAEMPVADIIKFIKPQIETSI